MEVLFQRIVFFVVCWMLHPLMPPRIYILPVGCFGIVRIAMERGTRINDRLKEVLIDISSQMV